MYAKSLAIRFACNFSQEVHGNSITVWRE